MPSTLINLRQLFLAGLAAKLWAWILGEILIAPSIGRVLYHP